MSDSAFPSDICPLPPVTIALILNYRTPTDTIQAVQSLEASGLDGSAILIVDNASRDGSVERLRSELPGVRLLVAAANDGFSAGCNLGIREALRLGAARVLLLNSDVTVLPGTVDALDRALAADPRLGIVGPMVVSREDRGRLESLGISYHAGTGRMRNVGHAQNLRSLPRFDRRVVDAVTGCAMMIRREVFDAVGLLAEEYFFGFEDLDFCLRARLAGFASACIGSATVLHEGSVSMGRHSPARVYYAARNQLLLASRVSGSQFFPARWLRAASIVALNLAYVALQPDVPRLQGLSALAGGVRDHLAGRYGEGKFPRTDGPNQDTTRKSPPLGRL